jgi:hypothetical protein
MEAAEAGQTIGKGSGLTKRKQSEFSPYPTAATSVLAPRQRGSAFPILRSPTRILDFDEEKDMYGTVARFRVKPGLDGKLKDMVAAYEGLKIPGHVNTTVYRLDSGNNEFMMTVVFESKAAYIKNADSSGQDTRYQEMLMVLDGEPDWSDGEIVYSGP